MHESHCRGRQLTSRQTTGGAIFQSFYKNKRRVQLLFTFCFMLRIIVFARSNYTRIANTCSGKKNPFSCCLENLYLPTFLRSCKLQVFFTNIIVYLFYSVHFYNDRSFQCILNQNQFVGQSKKTLGRFPGIFS